MATDQSVAKTTMPVWFWFAGLIGLAWNLFGVVQFLGSVNASVDSLMAKGMSAEQAAVMTGYPVWMSIAFAVGVFGGMLGSILLLMRKALSVPVFAVSLIGYVLLYIGDIMEGVFASLGTSQVVVLTVVVAIAIALLWLARHFASRGNLA